MSARIESPPAADERLRMMLARMGRCLVAGAAAGARALLERVVGLAPNHVPFRLSLAAALRRLELRDEEFAMLEEALVLDPTHVVVLLKKAALLDMMGKPRTAALVYGGGLQALPPSVLGGGAGRRRMPTSSTLGERMRRRRHDRARGLERFRHVARTRPRARGGGRARRV